MMQDAREAAAAPPPNPSSDDAHDHDGHGDEDAGPMVLLRVRAGHQGGVQPGDLVGAITGEARIPSSQIGRIRVNAGYSIVEVPKHLAGRVVTALRRTTIRGQSVEVRPH